MHAGFVAQAALNEATPLVSRLAADRARDLVVRRDGEPRHVDPLPLAAERSPSDLSVGEVVIPPSGRIQPRRDRRHEMEAETRVPLHPTLHTKPYSSECRHSSYGAYLEPISQGSRRGGPYKCRVPGVGTDLIRIKHGDMRRPSIPSSCPMPVQLVKPVPTP